MFGGHDAWRCFPEADCDLGPYSVQMEKRVHVDNLGTNIRDGTLTCERLTIIGVFRTLIVLAQAWERLVVDE